MEKVLLILPDTLWMILNLQSERLTLSHFRVQFEILRRLNAGFMKSIEAYLSRTTSVLYATLFLHHGEPLGSLADVLAKAGTASVEVAHLSSWEFFVFPPVDVFFRTLIPQGLEIKAPEVISIQTVARPGLMPLQIPDWAAATPAWFESERTNRALSMGSNRWAVMGYDKADPEQGPWQIDVDTCTREVIAYRTLILSGKSMMAKWTADLPLPICAGH
jgi:hypothetical protein